MVLFGGLWVYSLVTGKNLKRYVELARSFMEAVSASLTVFGERYPNKTIDVMLAVIEIAKTAAAHAEQLFKNGSIDKEARKSAALEYAYAALELIGVKLTDSIRTIVDGAIEAACLLDIPHNTVPNTDNG